MIHLLIDGDVVAYKAACVVERAFEWEPGHWTWHADEMEARAAIEAEIDFLMDKLGGGKFTLALTDTTNFRKAILPTYKGNRKGVKKPLVLQAIRQWLIEEKGAKMKPTLEGDDVLGILATMKQSKLTQPEDRIIVSIDKDMKTIPGLFYRNADDGVVEISERQADRYHMLQTLMGDTTDGYSGCPGIGAKKAEAMVAPLYHGVDAPLEMDRTWERVVEAFAKAGLDEHAALTQARVARILRASDYNFSRKEPILWTPPPTSRPNTPHTSTKP